MYAPSRGSQLLRCSDSCSRAFSAALWRLNPSTRPFSSSQQCLSKIGREPLSIPPEVQFNITPPRKGTGMKGGRQQSMAIAHIKGPLGEVHMPIPSYLKVDQTLNANAPTIQVEDSRQRTQREMWGTTRAYLQNHILGVSEGHTAILRLVGVGYRATVETSASTVESEYQGQQFVNLRVGYSHPVELGIPQGIKASTPQPTRILLEGVDKAAVMQFAAEIRMWRKPEPYKGKGIFVNGETIKIKPKKIK